MNLALNNLQWLICRKTNTNQTKPRKCLEIHLGSNEKEIHIYTHDLQTKC